MFKTERLIIIIAATLFSCTSNSSNIIKKKTVKTDTAPITNFHIGDCFLFKDSINDFGLVLLDIKNLPEGQWYYLFPVKLDRNKSDLDQFKYGEVYLTQLINNDHSEPKEGFMGFAFQYEKNFESINRLMNYKGSFKINQQYANPLCGTAAEDYWGFQVVLEQWNDIFGFDTDNAKKERRKLIEVLD